VKGADAQWVDGQWLEFAASEKLLAMRYVPREVADATIAVYDSGTGKSVTSATAKNGAGQFSLKAVPCGVSPKGDWLVYGDDESLRFLALPPHKPEFAGRGRIKLGEQRTDDLVGVWLDEKGDCAFVARDLGHTCELEKWDLVKRMRSPFQRIAQSLPPRALALCGPIRRLAVSLRDIETGETSIDCSTLADKVATTTIQTRVEASSLAFSPDGKVLFAGCADGSVAWYNTATGKLIKQAPRLGQQQVSAVAVHPDGKHLACGTWDAGGPNLFLLDVTSGEIMVKLTADQRTVHRTCFSPSGERLAAFGSSGKVTIWDATALLRIQKD
jgi:WD40 repeat protein